VAVTSLKESLRYSLPPKLQNITLISYLNKPVHISTINSDKVGQETESSVPQSQLALECIQSPHGFIVTAFAFEEFLTYNSLHFALHSLMRLLDIRNYSNLADVADAAQSLILSGKMPPSLELAIIHAYHELGINEPVVVHPHNFTMNVDRRKVVTGNEHSNTRTVSGEINLLTEVQHCFAELYTGEVIKYRQNNNCVHDKAALSVTIQKLMRLPKSVNASRDESLIQNN
jgi:pyruvate,water dikinase